MSDPSTPPPTAHNQLNEPLQPLPGSPGPSLEGHAAAPSTAGSQSASLLDTPAMDEAAKQNFLWNTHGYLNEYARFGDTKAGFAGTAAAAFLGALYSARAHVPVVQTSFHQWTVSSWLVLLGTVFLVLSVLLAVWTIRPRLRSTQTKGFIYWGSIAAHQRLELLQTSFHGQSARTLNDHLLHHVFDISTKVCVPKYRYVSLCMLCLVIGSILGGSALLLQDQQQGSTVSSPSPVQTDTPGKP